MPGHASVPGGLACTLVRGSGVSCQIAAAVGGTARGGSPGRTQRGTRRMSFACARSSPTSITNSPTVLASGGRTANRLTRTAPGGVPTAAPGVRGQRVLGPGTGEIPLTSSGGGGPANTTQTDPVVAAVPRVRRRARRRARRQPAAGERTGTEVGRGRAHVVGSELAATGCLRRRAVAAPDPGCERERRHQNQRKQCAARARHDHHADLRGVAVASTRTSNASPPSRRSNVKRTSPRTVTVTDSRLLAHLHAAHRRGVELTSQAPSCARLGNLGNEHQDPGLPVAVFVDCRRTGQRGRVGTRRERAACREAPPEIHADPTECEHHQAQTEDPERDGAPLSGAATPHGGHRSLT